MAEIISFEHVDKSVLVEMIPKLKKQGLFNQVFLPCETVQSWTASIELGVRDGFIFMEQGEPVACVYFTNPTGRVAQVHFWGYKEIQGQAVKYMQEAMLFTASNYDWTHIYGRYSDKSPLITRAARQAGFEILGTIPNKVYLPDGRLSGEVIAVYNLDQHREA